MGPFSMSTVNDLTSEAIGSFELGLVIILESWLLSIVVCVKSLMSLVFCFFVYSGVKLSLKKSAVKKKQVEMMIGQNIITREYPLHCTNKLVQTV